jgi:DeoR/GlpR family transcriptional regulator of sugar metabolism
VAELLGAQRRTRILEEVARAGSVRVSDLTVALGVSEMTVRRDLDRLGREGLLQKVHGGATAVRQRSSAEAGFRASTLRRPEAKEAIARAAVRLVEQGQTVALGAGTTTWALAHQLVHVEDLTVITNSVHIADVLRGSCDVVILGGVRTPSDALVGPVADQTLRGLHVDVAFLGCHGFSPAGLTAPNLAEAETNRGIVRAAGRLVVLADSAKWDTVGLMAYAALSELDVLVTDDGLPQDVREAVAAQVRVLEIARIPPTESAAR